jgi:hypothetical protein
MDIFFVVLISGMAVAYVVELLAMLLPSNVIKVVLTIPFSVLANWSLGLTDYSLIVGSLASGFFALFAISLINRPVVVNSSLRR